MQLRGLLLIAGLLILNLIACADDDNCNLQAAFQATGFFTVAEADSGWWLVDPNGEAFYSIGLNHVSGDGYSDRETGTCPYCETIETKYGTREAWRQATGERLRDWGFNTIGAWSDDASFGEGLAHTPILNMTSGVEDWFSPALEERAAQVAEEKVRPRRDDPAVLGWFLGNEMHWGPDWRSGSPVLDDYLALAEGSPGRVMAESYRGDPEGFLRAYARRFFEVAVSAVREEDTNHLILGIRGSSLSTPEIVVEVAGEFVDVFSVNHYDLPEVWQGLYETFDTTSIDNWLIRYHELSNRPIMITEFTYRSKESDVPNTYPPIYYLFDTQRERAEAYRRYAENCFDSPYIVGHHWFEYFDDPPGGRSDGEDSNFGLVNNADEVYEDMIEVMTDVHRLAPHL